MRALLCLLLAAISPCRLLAGDPLPVPADAVELAYFDAVKLYEPARFRYIWLSGKISKDSLSDMRLVAYAGALICRTQAKPKPELVASDKTLVLRVDTKLYAYEQDWLNFINVWEEFRFDPRFSQFVTQGSIDLAKQKLLGNVTRIALADNVRFLLQETADEVLKRDGVIRLVPTHVGEKWALLSSLLLTEAPVIDFRYFIYRSMLAVKNDDRRVYKTIYGGLYYDLADIPGNSRKGTDLDNLLEKLGSGSQDRKKTAKQFLEDLRSDQRLAIFRSKVTGRQRLIELFRTRAVRADLGQSLFTITTDFGEADIDIDQNPIANLLDVQRIKAHEAIWERPNGMLGFALYDAAFKRQDSVPDDVANDYLTPAPHPRRLQPAFSCIRCHGQSDGFHETANDVKRMLDTKAWDIFADLTKKDQKDAVDRIVELYAGDFSRVFRIARNDYGLNVYAATGPWRESKTQLDIVQIAAKRMEIVFGSYWYDLVDSRQALAETGYEATGKDNPDLIFASRVLNLKNQGITIEHPAIAALRTGAKINRSEFDLIYAGIMETKR